jgi:hypothetical protein
VVHLRSIILIGLGLLLVACTPDCTFIDANIMFGMPDASCDAGVQGVGISVGEQE